MDSYKSVLPYMTSLDRHRRVGEGSTAQTGGGASQRQGQLVRSSDRVLDFATYYDASELGLHDTAGSTASGLQKQTDFLTHRPN